MTRKIVINKAIGGFCLSDEAFEAYLNALNIKFYKSGTSSYLEYLDSYNGDLLYDDQDNLLAPTSVPRADPLLIAIVEELGEKSARREGSLKIVEIPENVYWEIHESEEGYESVHEVHRVWS